VHFSMNDASSSRAANASRCSRVLVGLEGGGWCSAANMYGIGSNYLRPTQQTLDGSLSLVWGRGDARAFRWATASNQEALLEASARSGCTPLHLALAARRWEDAACILRDPGPIALRWLGLLARRALQAADDSQAAALALEETARRSPAAPASARLRAAAARRAATASESPRGRELAQSAREAAARAIADALAAWELCSGCRISEEKEEALHALANAEEMNDLVSDAETGTDADWTRTIAERWAQRGAYLADHEFRYRDFTTLHIAAANAAPLHLVNTILRVGSAARLARATCSVQPMLADSGQSADVPLGQMLQPVHVAIKADGAGELVQLLLQAKGREMSQWQTACTCTVWGQTRQYAPLELARHHQNKRLATLLQAFERDGSAACESAALVTAMQRCEQTVLLFFLHLISSFLF
jgi:hypothetical protein